MPMSDGYTVLKALHVACVVAMASLFVVRAALSLARPQALRAHWARVLPHAVDTVLLAAAVGLLAVGRIDPLATPWLQAKLGGLLVYVGLGTVALKRGRTRGVRLAAGLLALAVLAWMAAVAHAKSPWPF